jgi:tight adherence protein C
MAEIGDNTSAPGTRGDLISNFRGGKRSGRAATAGAGGMGGPQLTPAQLRANMRAASFGQRAGRRFLELGSHFAEQVLSNVQIDLIRARLLRAGFPYGLKATQFAFLKWVGMVSIAFVFLASVPPVAKIVFSLDETPVMGLLSMLAGGFYGFKMPDIWLNIRTKQRQAEMQMALPDMIDLITVSVEAGLGLAAAIQRVAGRFPSALSEEFIRAMGEVHLGRSQAEAMREMGRRLQVPDLTTFLTALVQAETLGLPIANVLRVQAERLREKRAQRAREQAQKAPVKMIFPLVFFIFPAIFFVILGPAAIKIMDSGL